MKNEFLLINEYVGLEMVLLLIQDLTEASLCPLQRGDAKVELFSVENSHVLLSVFASRSGKGTRRPL
jgi:hypothetical protein